MFESGQIRKPKKKFLMFECKQIEMESFNPPAQLFQNSYAFLPSKYSTKKIHFIILKDRFKTEFSNHFFWSVKLITHSKINGEMPLNSYKIKFFEAIIDVKSYLSKDLFVLFEKDIADNLIGELLEPLE
jgi:hypothetical protein